MSYASCCVLSYNRSGFLWEGLMTLLHAGAPLELIIHDDGSSDDGVYRVLNEFRDRATIIANPPGHNQGQGTALNRMFRMATGDPIIKLDQDLIFTPNWLAKVNALMDQEHHERERLGLLGLFHYHHDPCDSAKTLIEQHDGWSSRTHILGSAFAVRRECWEELGPFEEHSAAFAEDWVFQRKVTDSDAWVCGLPDEDLVANQGFGVGPSTVVVGTPTAPTVTPIHTGPKVLR